MAETKSQVQTREQQQRGVSRRPDYSPTRDLFGMSPFSMMRRLTEEMDRAFGSAFGLSQSMGDGMLSPPIEVREHEGKLEIRAELPGLSKDDVHVECLDDRITIEGEKRREAESEERGWYRSERSYGHFCRIVPLPEGTDASKVKAEFKNGVLHVDVPLSEQSRKARQIQIEG